MIYDYIIIGGGPTGITLSTMLANTNYKTLILESEHSLGGNWKVDMDGKYLTEHSPKVLFSNNHYFFQLLQIIGASQNSVHKVHGSFGNIKIMKSFLKNMSFTDTLKLVQLITHYFINPKTFDYYQSVKDWAEYQNISQNGCSFLKVLSIITSNTYDKICVGAFIEFALFDPGLFMELVYLNRPNEWIHHAHKYLSSYKNLQILYDSHVLSIDDVQGIVRVENGNTFVGKNIILATPISACYNIINNSTMSLKSNWFPSMNDFQHFVDMSTYLGLGFQFHFDRQVSMPSQWCWSCFHDWTVIILEKKVNEQLSSKDPKVKCVWSCVIVDLDTKSKRLNKTVNECDTMDEIINEAIHQINTTRKKSIPKPYKITHHKNITRKDGKWETMNTSYANSIGKVHYAGKKVKNVFMVGPHNIGSLTIIEFAVKSAIIFGNQKKINTVFKIRSYSILYIFLCIVMAYISVYLIAHKM